MKMKCIKQFSVQTEQFISDETDLVISTQDIEDALNNSIFADGVKFVVIEINSTIEPEG